MQDFDRCERTVNASLTLSLETVLYLAQVGTLHVDS